MSAPLLPELRAVQRARVVLQFVEDGESHHSPSTGWALVDGHWLLWLPDDGDGWVSWPIQHVLCVEWLIAVREADERAPEPKPLPGPSNAAARYM